MIKHSVGFLATQLASMLFNDFTLVCKELNLSVWHSGVLFVALEGKFSQVKIAEILRRDKNSIGANIDDLVRFGYIKRKQNPNNRKENLILLTTKGKELARMLYKKMQERQREILNFLDDESFKSLADTLEKIYQEFLLRKNNENNTTHISTQF